MNEHNRNDYGLKNLSSYLHAASKLKKNGNILANSNSTHSLIRNKSGNKYYNIKDHSNYNTTINDYFNMNISREGDSYEVSLNEARFDKQDKLGASTYNRFKDSSFNNNLRSERNSKHTQASELKPSNKTSIYSKISSMKYRNKPNPKFGKKDNSVIIAYGANTYQGLFRNYNEDRVSIILNVIKPNSRMNDEWPSVSFFAIYDGHGGHECADFLRDNLHHYIFKNKSFPYEPIKAIQLGFEEAEQAFMNDHKPKNLLRDVEHSGSCAIVVIIVEDVCYVANLGDSRALYSEDGSRKLYTLSRDHKPSEIEEKERILQAGGKVYQSQINGGNINLSQLPWRIMPGQLSVSRSFGDIEAKLPECGGNPNVLIAKPEIISFKLDCKSDFIVLGCDGIFDRLSNMDIINCIWETKREEFKLNKISNQCGVVVDMIINYSLFKRTTDNVTCIFICFENFRKLIEEDFPCPRIPGSFHYKEDENLNFLHLKSKNKLNCDFNTEMTKITNTKPSPISLSTYRGAFPKFKFNNNMYLQGELFNQFETLDKFHTQKNKQQADLPSVRTFYNGGLSSNRNFPTLTPRSKGNKKI